MNFYEDLMLHYKRRNNPDYHNWLAVGDAVRILCGSLRHYAEAKMKDLHASITSKLGTTKCTCLVTPGKKSNPHKNTKTWCVWAQELSKHHCIRKISRIPWHQSNSSKWDDPTDGYWEIAKIFMSELGSNSTNVKDPSSTDPTGLLNLLYFCTYFNIQQSLVKSIRDWRNKLAHSPDQLLQDPDKQSAFNDIFHLLDDPELMASKEVQNCRKQIEEVRGSDISILRKDELCILKEFKTFKELESNRHERKKMGKVMKKLANDTHGRALNRDLRNSPNVDETHTTIQGTELVILFISFILGNIFGLFQNGAKGLRWFLLMLIFLQVGDKSMLSSNTGCFRATVKSPISSLQFQEFNFSSYLNYKRDNFFGRKWFFRELENVFENISCPLHGVLILGEPGFGKSAIMSELICSPFSSLLIHDNIIGYHLCDYSEKGKRDGARFVRNLVDQIAGSIPEYAHHVTNNEQIRRELNKRCESDPIGCFHSTIVGPLRELKNQPDSLRYILIDALDECIENDATTSTVLDILGHKISVFPTWLKIILTSRNWTAVTNKIPRTVKRMTFNHSDENNLEDIRLYIRHFWFKNSFFVDRLLEAMGLSSTAEGRNSLVNELSNIGEGNFLYIKTTLQYLNESEGRINWKSFPTSLYDTYRIYFKRQFNEESFRRFQALFEVLIAATSPLRLSEIDSILKLQFNESYEAYDLVKQVSGLLHFGPNETVQIYHQSFAEWLEGKPVDVGKLTISKAKGHEYIADNFLHNLRIRSISPTFKELSALAFHLVQSGVAEKFTKRLELINVTEIRNPCTNSCILHELALKDENALILDMFLRLFASADIQNIYKMTPALYATSKGNVENLKVLIRKGIDVNYVMDLPEYLDRSLLTLDLRRVGKYSIIHVACYEGHIKIVELLLKSNASFEKPSETGLTPLHLAAEQGHIDIVKLLYNAGSTTDAIALHHAAANNHSKVVEFLLNVMKIPDECLPCKTCGVPDFTQCTTVQKIHIIYHETALCAAVSRNHKEIVKLLLSFGNSALECRHLSGKTVLMNAVEKNDTEMVELLLHAGANVETVCGQNSTEQLKETQVTLTSSFQSDLYALDYKNTCSCGDKAIHHCAKYGLWQIAELILEKDKNMLAPNCEDFLPLDVAVLYDHVDFIRNFNRTLLETQHRYMTNKAFARYASWCGSSKALELLSDNMYHEDFLMVDENEMTFLHYAVGWSPYRNTGIPELKICSLVVDGDYCTQGYGTEVKKEFGKRLATVKILVKSQVDRSSFVNKKDKNGRTALHYAAMAGFVDALKYLVKHGGDWNMKDRDGNTPLTLALAASPSRPDCFIRCYRTYDKLQFRICNTTMYDATVGYLVWLQRSTIRECDLESANLSATAVRKQMPLTLYTLLKVGLDLNCEIGEFQRLFLTQLNIGGQQVSEVFKMFEINITVECDVPFRESELHLISHLVIHDDLGNFFKPSANNRSFPFQRLPVNHPKGFRIFDECRDREGYLAIHRAAEAGNIDAIQWLISVGVKTSLKTKSGLTALDLSILHLRNGISICSLDLDIRNVVTTMVPHRLLAFETLLEKTLKAIGYDWRILWCNPKRDTLSPLHLAATMGIRILNFVYTKARRIVPDLSLECYNKHGVGPLYLAYLYEGVNYDPKLHREFACREIDITSLQYPDREAEYHIIYNRIYKSPTQNILNFLDPAELRYWADEITNCPNFYDLLPNREMLRNRRSHCFDNFSLWLLDIGIIKNIPISLKLNLIKYYRFISTEVGPLTSIRSTYVMIFSWLKYYFGKKGSFTLWSYATQALKHHHDCMCIQTMNELQLSVTFLPQNIGTTVNEFTEKRMGWELDSTIDYVRDRWPFFFLFKKAIGEYKSYEYLNILNQGPAILYIYD